LSDPEQLTKLIQSFADLVDGVTPGARRYAPVVGQFGFGISNAGGLSVVWVAPGEPWFLTMTAGILHAVTNIPAALVWANDRNSKESFGRYYCSTPEQHPDYCNIVYQTSVYSAQFDEFQDAARNNAIDLLRLVVDVAEKVPPESLSTLPGQRFSDQDDDLNTLVAASFG
jgi:hypothetical protein